MLACGLAGMVTVCSAVPVQPDASLTVTVYVPAFWTEMPAADWKSQAKMLADKIGQATTELRNAL